MPIDEVDHRAAYREGVEGSRHGKVEADCPYPDEPLRSEWLDGWTAENASKPLPES